ncbi:MAG: hypothetical protein ACYC5K_06875, partial [Saccharofermentanales bacterium]
MNDSDRMMLRDLARRVREAADSPEESEKRGRIKQLNSLHRVKPPVLLGVTGEIMEHYMPYRESATIGSDEFFKGVEYWLRW